MESFEGRDELAPIFWYLTYFHEAGHAIAALQSGRPVNEIYIHPTDGYTCHGLDKSDYNAEDCRFIVTAGPWAEVRALWAILGIDKDAHDDAGLSFGHKLRDFLRKNSDDWRDYHQALGHTVSEDDRRQARDAYFDVGVPPPYECPPEGGWDALPEQLWFEARRLAMAMLGAEDVIEIGYGQLPLDRLPPTRWRRRGWQPSELSTAAEN